MSKLATPYRAGLMGATDKEQLDGLPSALAGKADTSHSHTPAGWTLLASSDSTGQTGGVSSISLNNLDWDDGYVDYLVVFEQLEHFNLDFSRGIQIKITHDASVSSFANCTPSFPDGEPHYGGVFIPGFRNDVGFMVGYTENVFINPGLDSNYPYPQGVAWRLTGGIKGMAFKVSGGNIKGIIKVYGR